MNNIKIANIIFVLIIVFFSCTEKNRETIVVFEKKNVPLSIDVRFGRFNDFFAPTVTPDQLIFRFAQAAPDYFSMWVGDVSTEVFLKPGDSLFVATDLLRSRQEAFSGQAGRLNNRLLNFRKKAAEGEEQIDWDFIYARPPSVFIQMIDSLYHLKMEKHDDLLLALKPVDAFFANTESARILYGAVSAKNRYYRDHKFLTKKRPVLDDTFKAYLAQLTFNNSSLLQTKAYRAFLWTFFESWGMEQKDVERSGCPFTELAFMKALELVQDQQCLDYCLYRIMEVHLNETPINELGVLINRFNERCVNPAYREKINRYYTQLNRLRKGKTAPAFRFPDPNGDTVSLDGFKGKIVCIDVWNSYCSPCFKEFPFIEKLIPEFDSNSVVFIGISFDADTQLWKKSLKTKHLDGIQLFANGWNHKFGKDYLVYSNPRFIVVGPEGDIIAAKAPKPSEGLGEFLHDLLDENDK